MEQAGDEIQVRFYLGPRMCFDLGEFELGIVGVHFTDLFPCGGSKYLNGRTAMLCYT